MFIIGFLSDDPNWPKMMIQYSSRKKDKDLKLVINVGWKWRETA